MSTHQLEQQKFDIRDYVDRLTPAREKGKYVCPVCNDPNLSIDNKKGGYTCYKGGCSASDIKEAIRPWSEVQEKLEAEREEKRKRPIAQHLSPAHLKEFAQSAIPEDLARLNFRSVECEHQIAEFLGWKGYRGSAGWLYTGIDPETGKDTGIGQFKPDELLVFPDKPKPAKYLSQKRGYDATCSRVLMWVWRKVSERYSVPLPDGTAAYKDSDEVTAAFWRWVLDNPQLPIAPTEGGKKALALLAQGIIGIAVSGVDMATVKGRGAELVPTLKKLAVKGRAIEPFYDADLIEKPEVKSALIGFGAALTRCGCVVTVRTWSLELGKGIDDLIATTGDNWEEATDTVSYKEWLKRLERQVSDTKDTESKKSEKQPPPQELGAEFAEDLRDQLCYSDEHKSWMKYELRHKGVWSAVNDDYVLSALHTMCKARGILPNNAYCANVLGALKRELFELDWLERPSNELLPFEDGVLEIENNRWHEHAPGFRLTWSLPRSYKGSAVNAGWAKINDWIDQATNGNQPKKEVLLAFIAASLRGMSNLQKFLMLTGPGGTGKGLYTRLTTMIVGERNTWIGNLEDLTKADKVAELQTKRLAVFDDQEKYTGNLSNFRSLTGGGQISGRKLYQNAVSFRFPGLALITANQPCFPASGLSWLKRRIVQEEFRYTPVKRNRHLERELEPELSAFTQYLLSIPVAEIERILSQEGCGINGTFWADRVRADPMASWVNDHLIHDPAAQTAIGADKDEWKDDDYAAAKSTLFGSYHHYCRRAGYSAKGKNNFSADLVELCREVLEWKDVVKDRSAGGTVVKGLRLRTDTDIAIATVEELLSQNVDLGLHDADLNVDLKALPHKVCVDHVDLQPKLLQKIEPEISGPMSDSNDSEEVIPPHVYTVSTNHTEQSIEPLDGLHSSLHSGLHSEGSGDLPPLTVETDTEAVAGEIALSDQPTADTNESVAEPELVKRLSEAALQVIAEKDPAAAKEVWEAIKVDETGVRKQAVKDSLTDDENEAFRILLNTKQSKSQPMESLEIVDDRVATPTESEPQTPSEPIAPSESEPEQPQTPLRPPSKHKNFAVGDRVVVAHDDGSMYEGAKGKVIKVKGQDVSIEFDKPVRGNNSATFNLASTIFMKL